MEGSPRRLTARRSRSVLWRQTLTGAVLLPHGSTDIYHLDATGARIWEMLEISMAVPALIERLSDTYDVEDVDVAEDVTRFLTELAGRGFIQLEGD